MTTPRSSNSNSESKYSSDVELIFSDNSQNNKDFISPLPNSVSTLNTEKKERKPTKLQTLTSSSKSDSTEFLKDEKQNSNNLDMQYHELEATDKDIYYESEKELKDVITEPNVSGETSEELAENTLKLFNEGVSNEYKKMDTTGYFGSAFRKFYRVNPGEFLVTAHNKNAALIKPKNSTDRLVLPMFTSASNVNEVVSTPKQSDIFYGAYGKYVLNVPSGKLALAWSGQTPKIYNTGCHVIFDPQFKINYDNTKTLDEQTCFVPQSKRYIKHGNIQIVRMNGGEVGLLWVGSDAKLLRPNDKPYVFVDALVRFCLDNQNSPFFNFNSDHISHHPIHLIRVSPGKMMKAFHKAKPLLLEGRDRYYQFKDSQFAIPEDAWSNVDEQLIQVGSLKRLNIKQGNVAVTYKSGKLEIINPEKTKQPYTITDVNHIVQPKLVSTRLQTMVFPSDTTIAQRKQSNPDAKYSELDTFTSSDSMPVGVKLMVAYEINNPEAAFLKFEDSTKILEHLENVTRGEMGKAISRCPYKLCLASKVTKLEEKKSDQTIVLSPQEDKHIFSVDEIKLKLNEDLAEYGIKLTRVSIETITVLNEEILKQMSLSAVKNAEIDAKSLTMEQQTQLAIKEREQASKVATLKQDNENALLISKSKAEIEAAKNYATAQTTKAQADADSANIKADGEAKAKKTIAIADAEVIEILSKSTMKQQERESEVLQKNPVFAELQTTRTLAPTLSRMSFNVSDKEFAPLALIKGIFSKPNDSLNSTSLSECSQSTSMEIKHSR